MKKQNSVTFQAEIRQVKMRKLVSLDKEMTVLLNTNELKVLELGKIDSDVVVEVRVQW